MNGDKLQLFLVFFSVEIDSSSINEQRRALIEHWEDKIAADATVKLAQAPPQQQQQLAPPLPSTPVPGTHPPSLTDFTSQPPVDDVDSDVIEEEVNPNESEIEREIRLVRQREEELRKERARAAQEYNSNRKSSSHSQQAISIDTKLNPVTSPQTVSSMPIRKLPTLTSPAGVTKPPAPATKQHTSQDRAQAQTFQEMTEVDRDALKRESIIEREIREQMAREDEIRQVRTHPVTSSLNNNNHSKSKKQVSCCFVVDVSVLDQSRQSSSDRRFL